MSSNRIIDKNSLLLGSGEVFFLDASASNYGMITPLATTTNLLSRMDNIKINVKRTFYVPKEAEQDVIVDGKPSPIAVAQSLEFLYYEHNQKTQTVFFGGKTTDVGKALYYLMRAPNPLRIEVKFTYPITKAALWYIFPKCYSMSELSFGPSNSEGFTDKGVFSIQSAAKENSVWYTTTTPCFNIV